MVTQMQIFLNYRTADEPFGVALIEQALSDRFGSEAVFFASRSIDLGASWESEMFTAVTRSTALLAVMGRYWRGAVDERGNAQIDNPDDFVRREILAAIQLGKTVIPIRLGVPRPKASEIPAELHTLLAKQDIELAFRTTRRDLDRLESKLRRAIPGLPTPGPATGSPAAPAAPRRKYGGNATHNEFHEVKVKTLNAGTIHRGRPGAGR